MFFRSGTTPSAGTARRRRLRRRRRRRPDRSGCADGGIERGLSRAGLFSAHGQHPVLASLLLNAAVATPREHEAAGAEPVPLLLRQHAQRRVRRVGQRPAPLGPLRLPHRLAVARPEMLPRQRRAAAPRVSLRRAILPAPPENRRHHRAATPLRLLPGQDGPEVIDQPAHIHPRTVLLCLFEAGVSKRGGGLLRVQGARGGRAGRGLGRATHPGVEPALHRALGSQRARQLRQPAARRGAAFQRGFGAGGGAKVAGAGAEAQGDADHGAHVVARLVRRVAAHKLAKGDDDPDAEDAGEDVLEEVERLLVAVRAQVFERGLGYIVGVTKPQVERALLLLPVGAGDVGHGQ